MKYVDIDSNKIVNLMNDKYDCFSTNPLDVKIELNDELTDKPDKTMLQLAILLEKYGCKNLNELDGFIESCVNRIKYDHDKVSIGKNNS